MSMITNSALEDMGLNNFMKDFFKKPQNILLTTTCLVLICYFGLKIFKEIESLKPETRNEKIMRCLELGSDARAKACIDLLSEEFKKKPVSRLSDRYQSLKLFQLT